MRSRSAPTSSRPGSSALASTSDQANTVIPAKGGDVAAAIDRRDMKGIGKPVERQRARERDDVPAVDQPAAEAALGLRELIEMDARGILIKPRRDLMLGLLHRHAVDVIDLLPHGVIAETVRRAGKRESRRRGRSAGMAWPSVAGSTARQSRGT